jgi:serine phosphatase RsbU (regulator of sigma subunit)
MRSKLSLRKKIIALVSMALAICLLSYIYLGTNLIIQDKTSYIYDYSLSQAKSAADKIEGTLSSAQVIAKTVAKIAEKKPEEQNDLIQSIFRTTENKIKSLLILKPKSDQKFTVVQEFGTEGFTLKNALDQLGWTPENLKNSRFLVGTHGSGKIAIGGMTDSASGDLGLAYFTLLDPAENGFAENKAFQVRLFDNIGNQIFSFNQANKLDLNFSTFVAGVLKNKFVSGVQEVEMTNSRYIAAYQKLALGNLVVVCALSKDDAFSAAKMLATRSFVLGMSLLLLVVGVSTLFARSMTERLKKMWELTKKVSEGDFTARVHFANKSSDEITDLADSFNVMANKIDDLLKETAVKARLEKELETAQVVQNRFFPATGFEHKNLKLSGKFLPATECSGDWWYYQQVGKYLTLVIGDVTGHGVSAALVTAAAHGAFTVCLAQYQEKNEEPNVKEIMEHLNSAIYLAAGKEATMTFLACVIDLESGKMKMANASHRPPYLYRVTEQNAAQEALKKIKPLMEGQGQALGHQLDFAIVPVEVELKPGDMMFLYTDGLLECKNAEGRPWGKVSFLKELGSLAEANNEKAENICEEVMKKTLTYLGDASGHRDDDITVVVVTLPKAANSTSEAAAA